MEDPLVALKTKQINNPFEPLPLEFIKGGTKKRQNFVKKNQRL
jgi:hypothetical protein